MMISTRQNLSDDHLPILALDVDGVLLEYLWGLGCFAEAQGHVLGCHRDEITDWDMRNYLPTMTLEERKATYVAFSRSEDFGRLMPYEGATDAIAQIRAAFPNLHVAAITSAGDSPETERMRRENLQVFGIEDITVLPLGASKREYFECLPAGSVVVDDLMCHVEAADAAGHTGVLFRRSYNAEIDHPMTVSTWPEAVDTISGLLRLAHAPQPVMAV